jgi:phytoene dehydrogenase-like protein
VASLSILVTRPTSQSVIVLGGGLAGLTAAYRLASRGTRVTLLERRSTLGGNALESSEGPESLPLAVSNSHHATWALWRSLSSQVSSPPLTYAPLEFLLPGGRTVAYPFTPLPRPLHIVLSLLRFDGLTWRERWRLVSWLEQIWEGALQLPSDLTHRTADGWLTWLGQGDQARRTVWDPLAQWLTGNQLRRLSADALCGAIEPTFLRSAHESRWAIISSPQTSLFRPMIEKLRTSSATVLLETEAALLLSEGDRVTGVLLRNGSTLQGDWYLAALPPRSLASLLPERWLSRYAYFQQLAELSDLPTTSAQVMLRRALTKQRILLLSGGPFYAMVTQPSGSDLTVCGFSGREEEASPPMTLEMLQNAAESVLRSSDLLSPGQTVVSFDYRKTAEGCLSLRPGMQLRRPLQRSPISNLLIAGAWTDTGWPPNAESAIVSANRCTEIVTGSRA